MIIIKITTSFLDWPLLRQTPTESGKWGECLFYVNNIDIKECDYWFIYDGLTKEEAVSCSPENIFFITGEPVSVKTYNKTFLKQFSTIITSQQGIKHKNIIFQQESLPWHVGRKVNNEKNISFSHNYDELKAISYFNKIKLLSLIVSNKDMTSGHKKRLDFIKKIREHFGDKVDIFGRGIQSIEDKWDAIEPYKYHIVLENSVTPHYWTEKLSDAYLGGAYPLYYGAPNIYEYFSSNALTLLDINDPALAIKTIERVINEDLYEKSRLDIMNARNLVLDQYNLFPNICNLVKNHKYSKSRTTVLLLPEETFNRSYQNLFSQIMSKIYYKLSKKVI